METAPKRGANLKAKETEMKQKAAVPAGKEHINELLKNADVDALDESIGEQDLSKLERTRFKQKKRVALRRKFVEAFVKEKRN